MRFQFPKAFAPALPVVLATARGIETRLLKRHSRARTDRDQSDCHQRLQPNPLSFDMRKSEDKALGLNDLAEFTVL
jgi:hypothetical protein